MLTRSEFIDYFKNLDSRINGNDPGCPLWIPEDEIPSQWFVCVKPIGVHKFKFSYYDWCNKTLVGRVRCYSSSSEDLQEWWGFTRQEDIPIWMLKWM